MKKKLLANMLVVCAVCLAVSGMARAEAIRELVSIHGAPPVALEGIGIVTGLSNTGDKGQAALSLLREYMGNNDLNFDSSSLATGNIALVRVSGEMPAFSRPGQKFNVTVTSMSDAKSLAGGELLLCNLYDRNVDSEGKRIVMAQANGQVIVGGSGLTRGMVMAGQNSGAMQLAVYPFGQIVDGEGVVRLNLNRPNWGDATAIARQINQTPFLNPYLQEATMFAEAEASRPVARPLDSGQVRVDIPPQYRREVTRYIDGLLSVPVSVNRPATILVNRNKNAIVITGDIRVNNATVSIQDKMVTVRPETPEEPAAYVLENDTPRNLVELEGPGTYADLQGLIDTLNAMGLTTEQVITVFEQLVASGAINAEFINQ